MAVRKSRFLALDQRTGRLERAINLVNDGQYEHLRVARGESDKYNPQTRSMRIPPDRVMHTKGATSIDPQSGPTSILVGYDGDDRTSNWQRPNLPSVTCATSGGYVTISETYGFGEYGFGEYGFGGDLGAEEITI